MSLSFLQFLPMPQLTQAGGASGTVSGSPQSVALQTTAAQRFRSLLAGLFPADFSGSSNAAIQIAGQTGQSDETLELLQLMDPENAEIFEQLQQQDKSGTILSALSCMMQLLCASSDDPAAAMQAASDAINTASGQNAIAIPAFPDLALPGDIQGKIFLPFETQSSGMQNGTTLFTMAPQWSSSEQRFYFPAAADASLLNGQTGKTLQAGIFTLDASLESALPNTQDDASPLLDVSNLRQAAQLILAGREAASQALTQVSQNASTSSAANAIAAPSANLSALLGLASVMAQKGVDPELAPARRVIDSLAERLGVRGVETRALPVGIQQIADAPAPSGVAETNALDTTPRSDQRILQIDVLDQVRGRLNLRQLAQQDNQSLKMELRPPELGRLQVELDLRSGHALRTVFHTETPIVREILQNNVTELRQAFAQQGYSDAQLEFTLGSWAQGRQDNRNTQNSGASGATGWNGPALSDDETDDAAWLNRARLRSIIGWHTGYRKVSIVA
ncbi:flagellar hook-length control protein FliK [Candidatus Sumerlaeota bacterium]|nr:flagellar hook-length control protein FliK [Candidatus Sumerlaeota bacterium]